MAEKLPDNEERKSVSETVERATGADISQTVAAGVAFGVAMLAAFKTVGWEIVDPYVLSLYMEALQHGTENDNCIRVNVVGNFGQGKTSLVHRLIGKEHNLDIRSTNGIDVLRYKCLKCSCGEISFSERKGMDSSELVRRVLTAKLDTDTQNSHQTAQVKLVPKGISKREIKILNKTPVRKLIKESNISRVTDSKEVHFDLWDFGGQHIFYATHTLFHSTKAVYLLVFNLSLPLNEIVQNVHKEGWLNTDSHTMDYFLQFWVNSVHCFVGHEDGFKPPIILVGTHKDKLGEDETEIKEKSGYIFDQVRSLFKGKQCLYHITRKEFAVDNTDPKDDSFGDILTTILQLGLDNSLKSIPVKWNQLEQRLSKMLEKGIVTLNEVKTANERIAYPLESLEQIKLFLKFHHDRGTLFYFDENPISNYVVLDPQYLIDAFKSIITPPRFRRNAPELQPYWQRLEEEAKLEMPLINSLWSAETSKDFMQHKSVLLSFLNKNLIISEAFEYNEETESYVGLGWFIVPSLLRDHISATEISSFLNEKNQTKIRFILTFDNSSIVPTVYHRLVAACVGKWSVASYKNKILLYRNLTVVRLDKKFAGLLEMNDIMIELSVIAPTNDYQINREITDCFRRFVESVVVYEFRKHRNAAVHEPKPYTIWYRCTHQSHKLQKSDVGKPMTDLDDEGEVPCPDSEPHLINVKSAKSEWFQGKIVLDIPDVALSDPHLGTLATCIGKNWECIAPDLRLTQVEIDHIKEDNKGSTVMQIYRMLQNWKLQQLETTTMKNLISILQNHPVVNVDWDKIRTVVEEIKSMK